MVFTLARGAKNKAQEAFSEAKGAVSNVKGAAVGAVTWTKDIIKSITKLLLAHRIVGWFVLFINFTLLFMMTYHLFFGYGKTILETEDVDKSTIARHKWILLFGDNGFFFIFALIFNVFLMKATVKYVYYSIYKNFGTSPRDSVYLKQLLNKYNIMKWK